MPVTTRTPDRLPTRYRPLSGALVLVAVFALGACQSSEAASGAAGRSVVGEEHLLDEGETSSDCTGSGCSDDGEFIGGATAGDVARQQAGRSAPAAPADVQVPSLVGLSPEDAAHVAEEHGLRLANGSVGSYGVVSSQTPRAGSRARPGSSILISVDYSAG